ncbi:bacteriocin immunity protein [Lactococcus fujiensis]|uniref:bacteriocin immunity protein n=1 Tax=Lactococcus fujiensis TaxID=610251 RepID=UPI002092F835|nr:bacteriocin immunity protein [Lactococcus fujiensis]
MEKLDKIQILNELYNLILDKHIRTYERQCLLKAKNQIEAGDGVKKYISRIRSNFAPPCIKI